MLHNQLWNLVPSFQRINSSKSDRLPDLSRYFEPFCRMQHEAYTTAIEWPDGAKKLEDYTVIAAKTDFLSSKNPLAYEDFASIMRRTIVPIHQIAFNQGYGVWVPQENQYN